MVERQIDGEERGMVKNVRSGKGMPASSMTLDINGGALAFARTSRIFYPKTLAQCYFFP